MRAALLSTFALVLAGAASGATMCIPGTLQDYVNLPFDVGCTLNGFTFENFELAPVLAGAIPIDPSTVQVTPGGGAIPQLLFTLNSNAGPGQILESFFRFNAIGGASVASIALGNPLAAGDGAVTGILDMCAGGLFLGIEPIGCSGTPATAIAFATAFDSMTFAATTFPTSHFFDVFVDLTVDGGLAGFASLDTATFTITPEPSVVTMIAAGLAVLSLTRMRRRRS
jgi:hypothetical protein